MKFKIFILGALLAFSLDGLAQTLFVPSGTGGIGTSTVTGKVGIGISNPSELLHINGSIRGNISGALRISSGNGTVDVGAQNSTWAHIYTDRAKFIFNKPIYTIGGQFSSYNTSDYLYLQTGGVTRLTVESDGDVITTGSVRIPYGRYLTVGYGNSINTRFEIQTSNETTHTYINFKKNLYFRAADEQWVCPLLLQYDGSVGIGFTTIYDVDADQTQGYKLAVNGGILCEEVKVIADVPNSDHVFQSNYKLMSLPELEKYVKTYSHLPEIPSAKEFKENGYKVGEMDDLLLRKVEELTLYVIELNKKVEELEQENSKLKEIIQQ